MGLNLFPNMSEPEEDNPVGGAATYWWEVGHDEADDVRYLNTETSKMGRQPDVRPLVGHPIPNTRLAVYHDMRALERAALAADQQNGCSSPFTGMIPSPTDGSPTFHTLHSSNLLPVRGDYWIGGSRIGVWEKLANFAVEHPRGGLACRYFGSTYQDGFNTTLTLCASLYHPLGRGGREYYFSDAESPLDVTITAEYPVNVTREELADREYTHRFFEASRALVSSSKPFYTPIDVFPITNHNHGRSGTIMPIFIPEAHEAITLHLNREVSVVSGAGVNSGARFNATVPFQCSEAFASTIETFKVTNATWLSLSSLHFPGSSQPWKGLQEASRVHCPEALPVIDILRTEVSADQHAYTLRYFDRPAGVVPDLEQRLEQDWHRLSLSTSLDLARTVGSRVLYNRLYPLPLTRRTHTLDVAHRVHSDLCITRRVYGTHYSTYYDLPSYSSASLGNRTFTPYTDSHSIVEHVPGTYLIIDRDVYPIPPELLAEDVRLHAVDIMRTAVPTKETEIYYFE